MFILKHLILNRQYLATSPHQLYVGDFFCVKLIENYGMNAYLGLIH